MQAVKTNIIGASNILNAAEEYDISKVVILSTDKAAYPINTMGMTKAIMEKVMIAKSRTSNSNTIFAGQDMEMLWVLEVLLYLCLLIK